MSTKPFALFAVAAVVMVGCHSTNDRDDDTTMSARDPHPERQTIANNEKLTGLPDAVQAAFLREPPTTVVSRIAPLRTEGPPMYKITYIAGNRVDSVIYRYDGQVFIATPPPQAPTAPLRV